MSRVHDDPESLSIGEVARLSGKAASAIRYYEEVGLVDVPERISGRRRYPRTVVRTLAVIETAQRAGLSLDDPPAASGDPVGSWGDAAAACGGRAEAPRAPAGNRAGGDRSSLARGRGEVLLPD